MPIVDTLPGSFFPHQVQAALRIQSQRRVLLADQPGLGKTLEFMLALELDGMLGRRSNILITSFMTALQLTWSPEVRKRIESQYNVVIADLTDPGTRKTPMSLAKREERLADRVIDANIEGVPLIVLANFEMLRRLPGKPSKVPTLFELEWDAFAIDEAHLVLPTQQDDIMKVSQFWRGLMQLQIKSDAIVLPMTGTPDRGKLENRYGHWKCLFPGFFTNFWSWADRSFVVTTEEIERRDPKAQPIKFQVIGKLRSPETWAGIDQRLVIRRTKAEVFKDMPAKRWAEEGGVDLPMTPAQRQAYDDYQQFLLEREAELVSEGEDDKAQALKLQFALRGRQMATCTWDFVEETAADGTVHTRGIPRVAGPEHSNKLAWILMWLEARGYTPENWDASLGKVVIVSYFVEVLNWLQAELDAAGVQSKVLSGSTPPHDKQRIMHEFQEGDLRVVLLSGTIGASINLDAADDMIFTDLDHDPDRLEQAEDRIHRASRMHQTVYWRLISLDTVDVVVAMNADARYQTTRRSYDGQRGVQFARQLLPKSWQTTERTAA